MPSQKLTELTQTTTLSNDDLVYVVTDPSGTPTSQGITKSNLITTLGVGSSGIETAEQAFTSVIACDKQYFSVNTNRHNQVAQIDFTANLTGAIINGGAVLEVTIDTDYAITFSSDFNAVSSVIPIVDNVFTGVDGETYRFVFFYTGAKIDCQISDVDDVNVVTQLTAPGLAVGTETATTIPLTITDNNTSPNEASTQIEYKRNVDSTWLVHGQAAQDATSYTVNGLLSSTLYDIRAKAIGVVGTSSNSAYSSTVQGTTAAGISTTNLIRYYRFNNDATDEKGLGDGTETSMVYATGKSGQAADFAGGSNYITIADAADLSFGNGSTDSAFSVSFFINVDVFDGEGSLDFVLNKRASSTNREYQIDFSSAAIRITLWDDSAGANIRTTSNSTTSTATWTHYVFTYDGSSTSAGLNIYENGSPIASTDSSSGTYTAMESLANDLVLGTQAWNIGTSSLNGKIDGLGVWDKELSAAEVTEIYNEQNAGSEIL